MTYTIAFNAFKESASALELTHAAADAVRSVDASAVIHSVPIGDGGDGTMEALVAASGGKIVRADSVDPLFRKIQAPYGILPDGTAVIEMAKASGLALIPSHERNPMRTTTLGTGMLIADAVKRGAGTVIVGVGGSATTDAGFGVAVALGYKLFDASGNDVPPTGAGLSALARIEAPKDKLAVKVIIASDVKNPLYGKKGAAYVYAPQKGANPAMVKILDEGLVNVARVIKRDLGIDVRKLPGGGAAGGLGAGLIAFAGGKMESGIDLVLRLSGMEKKIASSDVVFTGEGAVDSQTAFGKAPAGVAALCRKHRVPCILIAGTVKADAEALYRHGVTALYSITPGPVTLEDSMAHVKEYTARTVAAIVRTIRGMR